MDPELKTLLQRTHDLAEENHRILRAMRREQWWAFIARIVFWVVLVIGPLYFLAPYLSSLPSAGDLQKVLKVYQTGQFQ